MAGGGAGGVCVMVVVPTFAAGEQRDQPVIAAIVFRLIAAIAEDMGEGIYRPADVPDADRPQDAAPDEPAQAELQARCGGPRKKVSCGKASYKIE